MSKLAIRGGSPLLNKNKKLKASWRYMTLDRALAEYVGATYSQSVASGTAALVSALVGVGVGLGDEVITTPYTWVATVSSILHLGAIPVFADISKDTFCIDVESVRERITPRTKAILAVDIYGHPAPIRELLQIGKVSGVPIVEDACQAITASINGSKLGGIADITAFSWAGKPIHSRYDCGGAYTTNNETYFQRALLAGQHPFYIIENCHLPEAEQVWSMGGLGYNYRPTSNDAIENLWDADVRAQARRKNAHILTSALAEIPWITPPTEQDGCQHTFHFYTSLWDETSSGVTRSSFCEALAAEGLEVWAYIDMIRDFTILEKDRPRPAGPIHLRQRMCTDKSASHFTGYELGSLPVSESCASMEFCLPQQLLDPPCDIDDMKTILDVIYKVVENIDELR